MKCPECGCDKVNIQIVESEKVTKQSGIGLGGHAHNAVRGAMALGTLGMSNLFIKKAKGTEKTKTKNIKVAVCQGCGHSWEL